MAKAIAAFILFAGMFYPNVPTWSDQMPTTTTTLQKKKIKKWRVRPTYYHAVAAQTDSRFWETADGSNVNDFFYEDTIYIAVPQSKWKALRKYQFCNIVDYDNMPCKIVDVLNQRYNKHNRIDVLLQKGETLSSSDSVTVNLY